MQNTDRKLATIQKVDSIEPIKNADNIELARIKGWQCVVKKGEMAPGDLVVYFEIDSVLPVEPRYEFLRKGCYVNKDWLGEGFRLRTIKLRGQISQGLALPVHQCFQSNIDFEVGMDATEALFVKKWDPPVPACIAGLAKGNFPSFIQKTDQERIQNVYDDLSVSCKDMIFEATVKLDGSSCTLYHKDGELGACSRNLEMKITSENSGNAIVQQLARYSDALKNCGRNIAVQGELMGPGIQGNRENLKEAAFYVFDIFDIDNQCYLDAFERIPLTKELGMLHVPYYGQHYVFKQHDSLADLLISVESVKSLNHAVAEGLVFKSISDPEISFKAINNKFLLKEKE